MEKKAMSYLLTSKLKQQKQQKISVFLLEIFLFPEKNFIAFLKTQRDNQDSIHTICATYLSEKWM